jgi:hypothetical protein
VLILPAKDFNKIFFPEHAEPMIDSMDPGRANPVELLSTFVGGATSTCLLQPPPLVVVTVTSRHTSVAEPFSGFLIGSGASMALLGENITEVLGMSWRRGGGGGSVANTGFKGSAAACDAVATTCGKGLVMGESGFSWLPACASDEGQSISWSCTVVVVVVVVIIVPRPNGLRLGPCLSFAD